MNSDNTRDTLLAFDAYRAENDAHLTDETDTAATPARSCELFEGGLGI
jgi:hypothetical protein